MAITRTLALLLTLPVVGPGLPGAGAQGVEVEIGRGDPLQYRHCRFVPVAARTLRVQDLNWATDLDLVNTGDGFAWASVALLDRNADNRVTSFITLSEPLPPGATAHLEDVVTLVLPRLWRPWSGGLAVCADQPGLEAASRSYLLGADEATSVGQGVPAQTLAEAVSPGMVGHLVGLREDERFRSHVGLQNPSPVSLHVTLKLRDDDGGTVLTLVHDLRPFSQVQYNNVLTRFVQGVTRGRVEIRSPDGPVFAYANLVDNASDDPTYIACRVVTD